LYSQKKKKKKKGGCKKSEGERTAEKILSTREKETGSRGKLKRGTGRGGPSVTHRGRITGLCEKSSEKNLPETKKKGVSVVHDMKYPQKIEKKDETQGSTPQLKGRKEGND